MSGALGACAVPFVAEASPVTSGATRRVSVHTEESNAIALTIGGEHCLSLVVEFECAWDHAEHYLAVRRGSFKVETAEKSAPLFRYEFVDAINDSVPSAHLHIHAHRDEFLFALFRAGHGKPAIRAKAVTGEVKRARPQLSDVHFPLGGPRMRPCLEDVLQMLRVELGVDVEAEFQDVIDQGRARWRRRQLAAAVRDSPETASQVLRELGYSVDVPPGGPAPERIDKLTRI